VQEKKVLAAHVDGTRRRTGAQRANPVPARRCAHASGSVRESTAGLQALFRLLVPALLAALLAGCGFQLRGDVILPAEIRQLRLDMADVGPPIRRELVAALERGGVTLMPPDATGVAVLRVPVNMAYTEALTISEQARVREFAVIHRVVLSMLDADGNVILPEQEVVLQRDFVFDERDALGVAGQEEALRRDMEREMVRAIMRRIEGVNPAAALPPAR
jgi:LPS-assembly lipoprotein